MEAMLFAAGDPLSEAQLAKLLAMESIQVRDLVLELQKELDRRESALTIRQVAGGWQMATRPEFYHDLEKLSEVTERKLSTPTMETLSIIAFKQPITKQEIEQIRGVRVERSLAKLLELELVCEKGRKQVVGRPILYGTTEVFLKCFGLNSLENLPELPSIEEARKGLDMEQLTLLDMSQEEATPNSDSKSEIGEETEGLEWDTNAPSEEENGDLSRGPLGLELPGST